MSTHISTTPAGRMAPAVGAAARPTPVLWERFKKLIAPVASLRLTVVLFVLSLILVFCGTIAQKEFGNWTVVSRYFRSFYVWIPLKIFFPVSFLKNHPVAGGFPFPGGWLIGTVLLVNLLAAHLVRFRLTWKRSGILILHAGLVLMMVGELVTGLFAVEGNMSIVTDSSANYVVDQRAAELAVIDASDPKTDDVVVVPGRMLRRGGVVHSDELPFDLQVHTFMTNSDLALAEPGGKGLDPATATALTREGALVAHAPQGTTNPATAGLGRHLVALERPESSGADTSQKVDVPSAYVTLLKKGTDEVLGTYLVSTWFDEALGLLGLPQPVTVGGKTYDLSLRLKRTYKPYTVYLQEFRHDLYEGTDIPMNFSSQVRLVDPTEGEQREALIRMNEPLRYHGETFYQANWLPGDSGTVLQVVRNPGWLMPYFSCVLVAVGMLVHFGITLNGFLRKTLAAPAPVLAVATASDGGREALPLAAPGRGGNGITTARAPGGTAMAGRAATQVARQRAVAAPPAAPPSGFARFAPWVIVGLGLVYFIWAMIPPADPAGKMHLEEFASLPVKHNGRVKPMDTVARVGLTTVSGRQAYKFAARDDKDKKESGPPVQWLLDMMTSYFFKNRTGIDAEVVRIDSDQVLNFLGLPGREGFRYSMAELADKMKKIEDAATQAQRVEVSQRDAFQAKIIELAEKLHLAYRLAEMSEPLTIPPQVMGAHWETLPQAVQGMQDSQTPDQAAILFHRILSAYSKGDVPGFNKAVDDYRQELDRRVPDAAGTSGFEQFFNHFAPFYQCAVMYTLAFVLCCLSWLVWTRPLARAAYWLALLTLAVHTWALISRMIISGRPPVTNLYSSAIFIGWAAAVLCLGAEAVFRNGFGTLVASFGGAITMLLAHLMASGDTMEMLQAVLDTNFWLATHVTCVTLGYSTTYVAGLLGMLYIICGVVSGWKPDMDKSVFRVLAQMIYGVICFAMFFSFVGTVLGGIWADQSWGRFWGWDPKENGALLIVIWNALILHARWAGLVRSRGVAVLAVFGNIITSWSWFGTNMLGVGLHSYASASGAIALLGAMGVFVGFMAVGMSLPKRAWR
jgi:ABC-type transport system involved in cytochrome c biogenesis permease subunit